MLRKHPIFIMLLLVVAPVIDAQEFAQLLVPEQTKCVSEELNAPCPSDEPQPSNIQPLSTPHFVTTSVSQSQSNTAVPNKKWDWLQLTSGEWLKGELKIIYRDEMEFESEELDTLLLDLKDVHYVKSNTIVNVRVQIGRDEFLYVGRVELGAKKITVHTVSGNQSFDRNSIIAIVPSVERERNYWSLRVALGAYARRGNSDQLDYSSKINATRRTTKSRVSIDYIGVYTKTEDIETANSQRVGFSYDIYASQRRYIRPLFGESLRDPFQNIDSKITLGTGYGYYLYDTKRTEWDVSIGPAYQSTEFLTVEEGEDKNPSSFAIVGTSHLNIEITEAIDLIMDYRLQWAEKESGGYSHHLVTALDFEVTKSLDIGLSLVWDRVNYPTADKLGELPRKDDYTFSFDFSYDFN